MTLFLVGLLIIKLYLKTLFQHSNYSGTHTHTHTETHTQEALATSARQRVPEATTCKLVCDVPWHRTTLEAVQFAADGRLGTMHSPYGAVVPPELASSSSDLPECWSQMQGSHCL